MWYITGTGRVRTGYDVPGVIVVFVYRVRDADR